MCNISIFVNVKRGNGKFESVYTMYKSPSSESEMHALPLSQINPTIQYPKTISFWFPHIEK